jgi:hypothetical protein
MKQIYILISMLFITLYSQAQYKDGYIINNQNDTIYGLIEFSGEINNSELCKFKSTESESLVNYLPNNIKAFRFIDGKYFVSRTILIDSIPKTVFLQWLIKGQASILSYNTDVWQYFFILTAEDSLIELKNTTRIKREEATNFEIRNKEYIGALRYLYKDAPSLYDEIGNSSYTSKSLINITRKYHNIVCTDKECIIYEDKHRKLKTEAGIALGLLIAAPHLGTTTAIDEIKTRTFVPALTFRFSNLPRLSPKFSIITNLSVYNLVYKYGMDGWPFPGDDNRLLSTTLVSWPLMINYKFLNSTVTPFVEGGITMNFRINPQVNNTKLANYLLTPDNVTVKTFVPGYIVGLGIQAKLSDKISIHTRLNYSHFNFYQPVFLSTFSSISDVQILAGFLYSF